MERQLITGIAYDKNEAKITLTRGARQARRGGGDLPPAGRGDHQRRHDRPERRPGQRRDRRHLHRAQGRTGAGAGRAGAGARGDRLSPAADHETDIAKVSVVGVGMRSHAGVAAAMFKALAERRINILAITTSEIKVERADRGGLYRTRGARAAHRLWAGCGGCRLTVGQERLDPPHGARGRISRRPSRRSWAARCPGSRSAIWSRRCPMRAASA